LRTLKTITFLYNSQEDRILTAINAERPEAWSCWLTRRLVLALFEHKAAFLARTSTLLQRVPTDTRGELASFEHEAAIARTNKAMTRTAVDVLEKGATTAEIANRLTISHHGNAFRVEIIGKSGDGTTAVLAREQIERILQMLQDEVAKSGWLLTPTKPQATEDSGSTQSRH
jgi:hypothetical protein